MVYHRSELLDFNTHFKAGIPKVLRLIVRSIYSIRFDWVLLNAMQYSIQILLMKLFRIQTENECEKVDGRGGDDCGGVDDHDDDG